MDRVFHARFRQRVATETILLGSAAATLIRESKG
jgi:hypothetical protein